MTYGNQILKHTNISMYLPLVSVLKQNAETFILSIKIIFRDKNLGNITYTL
jgi:hypothetical protein